MYTFDTTLVEDSYEFTPSVVDNSLSTFNPDMNCIVETSDGTMIPPNHQALFGRSLANQHPISSITGLQEELDKIKQKEFLRGDVLVETTEYWNSHKDFVGDRGDLIVYIDYYKFTKPNNEILYIPAMKVADGNAYIFDKAFINDDIRIILNEHIINTSVHITEEERTFWNNKVSAIIDSNDEEALILTTKPIIY